MRCYQFCTTRAVIICCAMSVSLFANAQEQPTPTIPTISYEETHGEVVSLPNTPRTRTESPAKHPSREYLVKELIRYQQDHRRYWMRYRVVVEPQSNEEEAILDSLGYRRGKRHEYVCELATWDEWTWHRLIEYRRDGVLIGDRKQTPFLPDDYEAMKSKHSDATPLGGVLVPGLKTNLAELLSDQPDMTTQAGWEGEAAVLQFRHLQAEQKSTYELKLTPHATGHWLPTRLQAYPTPTAVGDGFTAGPDSTFIAEWEVEQVRTFRDGRAPRIASGVMRFAPTSKDGQRSVVTMRFEVEAAEYGDDVQLGNHGWNLPDEEASTLATEASTTPLSEVPGTPTAGPPSKLIEINDDNPPTPPTEQPTLEELLAQWDRYRKAHVPYHVRYRETIRPLSAREAKLMVTRGDPECREVVNEIESASWNDRSWRRPLAKLVDGRTLPTTIAPLQGTEYQSAKYVPHPEALSGVFYEPFAKDCSLDFDGPYPHITVKGEYPGETIEIWMMPAARWWFPKRIKHVIDGTKHDDELKDIVGSEWEVKHLKAFGPSRAPEVVDGVHRVTYRDGDEQTTITTDWVITKMLLGDKVVPGDIDPSLGPMSAPLAVATPAPATADKVTPDDPSAQPRVIIIETTPDIERSEVIRQVVEALEKDGKAKRGEIDRVGNPVAFDAILSPVNEMPQETVLKLVETLQSLGIDRMRFSAHREQTESSVIVICPADVAWRKVRSITEELEKLGDFKVDVRVADNNDPVTPVAVPAAAADQDGKAVPSPSTIVQENVVQNLNDDHAQIWKPKDATAPRDETATNVRVYTLKNTRAADAARIIEQLYDRALSVAMDERTNSLVIRGADDVANEVQALLKRLEDAAGASQSTGSPNGPAPEALDVKGGSLYGFEVGGVPGTDPNLFSFYIGTTGESASELRQQYDALERQAKGLSEQLRKPLPDPATGENLKSQLREAVKKAFETRQKLQRAELAEFAKRLQGIQQSIEMRDKISQQIIERRVQELLDPNLKWDSPAPASPSSGIIKSEWPVPAIFDRHGSPSTDSGHRVFTKELPQDEAVWEVVGIRADLVPEPLVIQGNSLPGALKITSIRLGSCAEAAGLKSGDVLFGLNGRTCPNLNALLDAWRVTRNVGNAIGMIDRSGQTYHVTFKWLPGTQQRASTDPSPTNAGTPTATPLPTLQVTIDQGKVGKLERLPGPGGLFIDDSDVARLNLPYGSTNEFHIRQIPGQMERVLHLEVTIPELAGSAVKSTATKLKNALLHNFAPLALTSEDLSAACGGTRVTKVIYVPHDESTFKDSPLSVVVSTRLDPSEDPVKKAESLGTPVVIARLSAAARAVKIQALLFDLDEKAEEFDLSKVQHDAPAELEAMLKAAAAKGEVTTLSRPQLITRLNQEAMLFSGQEVVLSQEGNQVNESREVGDKVVITPREENGKPVLRVAFDFSRVDPDAARSNDPDSTPFIQSHSGELTVRMNEYDGKGKLLGPFNAVPGKNRFLHLIVTLTDDVATSPIPPEIQGGWQFQKIAITGDPNHSPFPEHLADEMKGRPSLVIDGDQMTRTKRDGTQDVYAIQYDSTTTPHRLKITILRGGQERTQRYIVQADPGFLRLGTTTDGRGNFPNSFDEPRTLVETYKRVLTEPARSDADSKAGGSPKSSAAQPIKLDELQGNWRLIITGQASGKDAGGKTERQVLDATIRGNRLRVYPKTALPKNC